MITAMYYDTFTEEYTLTKDPIAPPERYLPATRGSRGIYIESWLGTVEGIEEECCLSIAYHEDQYYSNVHDWIMIDRFKDQHFTPKCLRYFVIPEDKFDEYVERFGLKEVVPDVTRRTEKD